MAEFVELNLDEMANVTGGRLVTINTGTDQNAAIRNAPGNGDIIASLENDTIVDTVGTPVYDSGTDRNWIRERDEAFLAPYREEIRYEMFRQFIFYRQWNRIRAYAGENGILLMGDLPFYVGQDSLDVWMNQDQFLLDPDGYPTHVAGVPPDYFSELGQRWGNPIYNWEKMQEDHYAFWKERMLASAALYDLIRIDHFRAFDTYWKIPASCPTAVEGEWIEAPGQAFFDEFLPDTEYLYFIFFRRNFQCELSGGLPRCRRFDSLVVGSSEQMCKLLSHSFPHNFPDLPLWLLISLYNPCFITTIIRISCPKPPTLFFS